MPPGDLDALGVDPAVGFRQQRGDHGADIIGHAGTAKRRHGGHPAVDFRIVAHHAAAEVGSDGARCDRVDGDAAGAEFVGHVARQHLDSALERAVGRGTRHGDAGKAAGKIDDAAAVGDYGQELLGQEEDALEMDVVELVHFLFGRLQDRGVVAGAGIVDEKVEALAAPALQHRADIVHESIEGGDIAGIELQGGGLAAERFDFRDDLVGLFAVGIIGEDHVDAITGEADDGVAAEAAAAAGDDCDFRICVLIGHLGCSLFG